MKNVSQFRLVPRIISTSLSVGSSLIFIVLYIVNSETSVLSNPLPWYIGFILIFLLIGMPMFRKGIISLVRERSLDENILMTIAIIAAAVLGELAEAISVLSFYLVGDFFEEYAVSKTHNSISSLEKLRPDFVLVESGAELKKIPARDISIGEEVVVPMGEIVALDGVLLNDTGTVDTSFLTGEPIPRVIKKNDTVLSGSINNGHMLRLEVVQNFSESTFSKVLQMVKESGDKKAKSEKIISRFARYYTPIVLIAAIIVATVIPLVFSQPFSKWIYRSIVLLIISCPCAFVIGLPLTYFCGIGAATKRGILFKGGEYIDTLARVNSIFFDKTGTLTEGNFLVRENKIVHGVNETLFWGLLYSLEKYSLHPIARAICLHVEKSIIHYKYVNTNDDIAERSGQGLESLSDQGMIRVGRADFIAKHINNPTQLSVLDQYDSYKSDLMSTVHISLDAAYLGAVYLSDAIHETAKLTVQTLLKMGIELRLLSGDTISRTLAVANQLSIKNAVGGLLPGDKLAHLEDQLLLRDMRSESIAFVGDGINDSPSIKRADIGIAMSSELAGTAVAVDNSDLVLLNGKPSDLIKAIQLSRKTRRIARQNIYIAIVVKLLIFIFGGILGFATLWTAVLSDVGLSLVTILNAIRLLSEHKT